EGNVQRHRSKENDPTIVLFDQYAFDLTRLAPAPRIFVGLRSKYFWELLFPAPDDAIFQIAPAQVRVEMHERILAPLYPLAFGVIAFSILGFPRTTRQSRAVSMFAVILGVAGVRLGGFAGTAMAVNQPGVLFGIYGVLFLLTAWGVFVVWRGVPLD